MDRANRRLSALRAQLAPEAAEDSVVRSLCSAVSPDFDGGKHVDGQVVIITGAAQGIGRAAALLFASHGAKLVISDLDGPKVTALADSIRQTGVKIISVTGDVTAQDFPKRLTDAAVKAFSGIDVLINNAGYTWDGVIHKMAEDQWQAMLDVHCTAPFRLIQATAPYMRGAAIKEKSELGAARPRSILNISSVSGTHGSPGQVNYSTAKSGLVGLTKTIAREWGQFNIRCNCLAFGYIQTRLTGSKEAGEAIKIGQREVKLGIPGANATAELSKMMIPLGRLGTPEEAANTMLLLSSPLASYISGQTIEVTGGAFV